jgi:methionyl-tRNA formyltransferase
LKIVFMGSAPISCRVLEALLDRENDYKEGRHRRPILAIVTQPDRPKGRGAVIEPSPVRVLAEKAGIPLLAPEKVNSPDVMSELMALRPDVIVVVAYGQLLGKTLLSIPPKGCINLHTSLLPRWRGAAPVQRALENGDAVTGVTIMQMNEAMDAGDILAQRELAVGADDTAATVLDRLSSIGGLLMKETLDRLSQGKISSRPQNGALVTFAPKLKKEEGQMDWLQSAVMLSNKVRAFNPWPVANCGMGSPEGERLQVYRAGVEPGSGEPGVILDVKGNGPLVATGQGALRLLEVQAAGRKRMNGAAFLCGQRLKPGDKLY